jgi:hypothetical protein
VQASCEPSTSNAHSFPPSTPITRRPSGEIDRCSLRSCGAFTIVVAVTFSVPMFKGEPPWAAVLQAATAATPQDRTISRIRTWASRADRTCQPVRGMNAFVAMTPGLSAGGFRTRRRRVGPKA